MLTLHDINYSKEKHSHQRYELWFLASQYDLYFNTHFTPQVHESCETPFWSLSNIIHYLFNNTYCITRQHFIRSNYQNYSTKHLLCPSVTKIATATLLLVSNTVLDLLLACRQSSEQAWASLNSISVLFFLITFIAYFIIKNKLIFIFQFQRLFPCKNSSHATDCAVITICTILVASGNRAGFIFGWNGACKDCHGVINKIDNKLKNAVAPIAALEIRPNIKHYYLHTVW